MNFENICRLYSSDVNISFPNKPPLIRSFYTSKEKKNYSIRWNAYESDANFSGETLGSDWFVLKGKSDVKIDEEIVRLKAGDYCKMPKCKYEFHVIGNDQFEFVAVYELPNDFVFPEF